MDYILLGKRIRDERLLLRLTLEKLAERTDKSINFIGQIERGEGKPSLETMVDIANALGLSNENQTILRMAIARLKEGDTIDTFYNYLKTVKPVKHPKPEGLDRFLSKFEKPVFIRKPENENLKTFDYIHLDISVLHEWETDRIQYISDNISEIKKRVINYLSNSKSYQKY